MSNIEDNIEECLCIEKIIQDEKKELVFICQMDFHETNTIYARKCPFCSVEHKNHFVKEYAGFEVDIEKQHFNCFSCCDSIDHTYPCQGDVVDFICKLKQMPRKGAARYLALKYELIKEREEGKT